MSLSTTDVPLRVKAAAKADATTAAAKQIIQSETAAREAKTRRLREARMKQEATEAEADGTQPAKTPARTRKAKPRRP